MSFLSNLIKDVAPIVAAVSPDPFTKAAATAVTYGQQQQEARYQEKISNR